MSKKLEGYKPQWDSKVFDGAHPDQEFKEIKSCEDCGGMIGEDNQPFRHDIDMSGCPHCRVGDMGIITVYQCSLCLKEHEKEECNCYEK